MNCEICLEPFDHSIHKPHHLECPHTYCLSCLKKLTNNKCPTCNKLFNQKNPNMALLKLIPESVYDKLKGEVLKACIELKEIDQDLKISRQSKINTHEARSKSIKQKISNETNKMINILRQNEKTLNAECDKILKEVRAKLDINNSIDYSELLTIFSSKEKIEKDVFDEEKLKDLNNLIPKLKHKLNELSIQIKKYENKYEFIPNNISNDNLLSIGQMHTSCGYNQKGYDFYKIQKYEEASICFDKAIKLEPNEAVYYKNKGDTLKQLKKFEEAIQCYDKLIELDPNDSNIYSFKGFALKQLKKFEEAIEYYDKAIKLDPSYTVYYLNKGTALKQLKKHEEAIQIYDKAIELSPNEADIYNNKGFSLNQLKKHEEAIKCFSKAIELNSNNDVYYHNKANTLYELTKFEEAIEYCDKAIELDPSYAVYYLNKGTALHELKKYEEAIQFYDKAIELDPNEAVYYHKQANNLYELKNYEEAIKYYDKAIELDPNNSIAYNKKGEALNKLKNFEEEIQCFAELEPNDLDAINCIKTLEPHSNV